MTHFNKFKVSLIFFFLIISLGQAQEFHSNEVGLSDLKAKENTIDSSADAAYLLYQTKLMFKNIRFAYGRRLFKKVHKRIKFYTTSESALEYATEEIFLYTGGTYEEDVFDIEATTYNLKSGEVVAQELDDDQIFEQEFEDRYKKISFTMPNIQEGSVIDIRYTKSSDYITQLDNLNFQFSIPAMVVDHELYSPKDMNFKASPKGYKIIEPTLRNDYAYGKETKVKHYQAKNMEAMKKEPFTDNIENYRAGILLDLASYDMSDGRRRNIANTWNDVASNIIEEADFERKLSRTNIFEDEIDELLKGKTDDLDKMNAILSYVQKHIKWNDRYGKYMDNGIRRTFKDKKGNAADVNLILVAMLKYAGLTANPFIISTRRHIRPFFPTLKRLDFTIACVGLNNKHYFLDATESNSKPNILPTRDYNYRGLLLDTDNGTFAVLPLAVPLKDKTRLFVNATLSENGKIEGKTQARYGNHLALVHQKRYESSSKSDFIRKLEKKQDNITVTDYDGEFNDEEAKFTESYNFEKENAVEKIGENWYLNPILFLAQEKNPFEKDDRDYPVNFDYPFHDNMAINLKIPEGYEVVSIPKPTKITYGKQVGIFYYRVLQGDQSVRTVMTFDFKTPFIPPENYSTFKDFFTSVIEKQNEQIVLTQTQENEDTARPESSGQVD